MLNFTVNNVVAFASYGIINVTHFTWYENPFRDGITSLYLIHSKPILCQIGISLLSQIGIGLLPFWGAQFLDFN